MPSPYGHRYWPYAYWPEPITTFSGLDLSKEPDEVGPDGAIDLLNVDLDKRGALRSRAGYSIPANINPASANRLWSVHSPAPGIVLAAEQLATGVIRRWATGFGASVAGSASAANLGGQCAFADFGSPTATDTYIQRLGQSIVRYDVNAATFSVPGTLPTTGNAIAVQPVDNRLVVAGGTANPSRVLFSDALAPETFNTTNWTTLVAGNWVDLTPGDGESIVALVAYRETLIAFKQTKFFVFYGNSQDGSGSAIFNYRTVNFGTGLQSPGAVAVAPEGVYFLDRKGVYVTTGGMPEKVSTPLDPLLTGTTLTTTSLPFYTGPTRHMPHSVGTTGSSDTLPTMTYVRGRVYLTLPQDRDGASNFILVYDVAIQHWLVWDVNAWSVCPLQYGASGPTTLLLTLGAGDTNPMILTASDDTNITDDNGVAISSRYRSGIFTPYGLPDLETSIRETIIEGVGTPTFSWSRDYQAPPTTGGGAKTAITLGTAPLPAQGRHRKTQRGRRLSWQVEGTAPWRLSSLTAHLNFPRPPGEQTH